MGELKALHIMCKRDNENVKVAPESVLSNKGNLEGTHLTRFSLGGGVISIHLWTVAEDVFFCES